MILIGKLTYFKNNLSPVPFFSTANSTLTGLGSNLGLHVERLVATLWYEGNKYYVSVGDM